MVVDDEDGVCAMVASVLKRYGFEVSAFTEPVKALASFREAPESFSIVVTDLTMPQMKGTGFAEAIWQVRPKIPILLTTGYGGAAEFESYREMGLRGPLIKPFMAEALIAAIDAGLAQAN